MKRLVSAPLELKPNQRPEPSTPRALEGSAVSTYPAWQKWPALKRIHLDEAATRRAEVKPAVLQAQRPEPPPSAPQPSIGKMHQRARRRRVAAHCEEGPVTPADSVPCLGAKKQPCHVVAIVQAKTMAVRMIAKVPQRPALQPASLSPRVH